MGSCVHQVTDSSVQDYYSATIFTQVYTMSTSEITQVALFLRTHSEFMQVEQGYAQYIAYTITSVGKILKSHRIGKR